MNLAPGAGGAKKTFRLVSRFSQLITAPSRTGVIVSDQRSSTVENSVKRPHLIEKHTDSLQLFTPLFHSLLRPWNPYDR